MCINVFVSVSLHTCMSTNGQENGRNQSFFPLISKPYDRAGLDLSTWSFKLIPWVLGDPEQHARF